MLMYTTLEVQKEGQKELNSSELSSNMLKDIKKVFLVSCLSHKVQLAFKEKLKRCKYFDLVIVKIWYVDKKIADSCKTFESILFEMF